MNSYVPTQEDIIITTEVFNEMDPFEYWNPQPEDYGIYEHEIINKDVA